ncbi:MAG: spore germination protein GerW family protein [Chloroflexota bacterium]
MSKEFEIISETIPSQKEATELMEKLIAAGHADAVFSPPVESGEYTVITVAEARVAMGYGFGGGSGVDQQDKQGESPTAAGYGGGGGGASMARPVAIIEIGPNGARVEPIVDPTKIALAFLSMLISIFAMGARLRRDAKV